MALVLAGSACRSARRVRKRHARYFLSAMQSRIPSLSSPKTIRCTSKVTSASPRCTGLPLRVYTPSAQGTVEGFGNYCARGSPD